MESGPFPFLPPQERSAQQSFHTLSQLHRLPLRFPMNLIARILNHLYMETKNLISIITFFSKLLPGGIKTH